MRVKSSCSTCRVQHSVPSLVEVILIIHLVGQGLVAFYCHFLPEASFALRGVDEILVNLQGFFLLPLLCVEVS